jgi:hypothetical protein
LALGFIGLAAVILIVFWIIFFSPRPPVTTDPATLAGDGSQINYSVLPVLDGGCKLAVDIPKGNTPGGSYSHFPLPVLAACTESLVEGSDDTRGLWRAVEAGYVGHVEQVKHCGRRLVVTSNCIIHDDGANSTLGETTNDTEVRVMFSVGATPYCARTSASMVWNEGVLDSHVFGWGPVVVRRYLEGKQLVWKYADGSKTWMNRICTLPEDQKHSRDS